MGNLLDCGNGIGIYYHFAHMQLPDTLLNPLNYPLANITGWLASSNLNHSIRHVDPAGLAAEPLDSLGI